MRLTKLFSALFVLLLSLSLSGCFLCDECAGKNKIEKRPVQLAMLGK